MKATNYTSFNEKELLEKISEEKAALAKMNFNHTIAGTENPMQLRYKRRDIARMLTALNQKKNTK
jgi:large subunit ribosomal protein L29